jgi:hypothetical protein
MSKGLEQLVSDHISEISSGIPWILIGKAQSTKGYRYWDAVVLHEDDTCACDMDFRKARLLFNDDNNAILINGYQNAWVGISEDGEYKSIKDVTKRIKAGYEAGRCKTSHLEIAMLKPMEILVKYIQATDETLPYMTEEDRAEWLDEREHLIKERKIPAVAKIDRDTL